MQVKILNMEKIYKVAWEVVSSIPPHYLSWADWEMITTIKENVAYDIVFALIWFLTSLLPLEKYDNAHKLILSNDQQIFDDILYIVKKTTNFNSFEEWEESMLSSVIKEYKKYIKKNFL